MAPRGVLPDLDSARSAPQPKWLANLAERLGADIERVRIGFQFIWPGCGYGGAKGLAGRRFALWSLALKPNTDDMQDAPAWPPTTPKPQKKPMPW